MKCHTCALCCAVPPCSTRVGVILHSAHDSVVTMQILLKYNEESKQYLPVSSDIAPSLEEHLPAHYDRNGWHFAENATICIYR